MFISTPPVHFTAAPAEPLGWALTASMEVHGHLLEVRRVVDGGPDDLWRALQEMARDLQAEVALYAA